MAHILWFSKFWNLIGESIRDLSSLLNYYGEERIMKIKQDATKYMQQFQDIKVGNPTIEADYTFTSFSSLLLFICGLELDFSWLMYWQRQTVSTGFIQRHYLHVSFHNHCHVLGNDSSHLIFKVLCTLSFPLWSFLLRIYLQTCLQSSF